MYIDHKVKLLHTILPKTSAYLKSYDIKIEWRYFLIKDDELLEKYFIIWDKVSADVKKTINSMPVYNEEFLKNKI